MWGRHAPVTRRHVVRSNMAVANSHPVETKATQNHPKVKHHGILFPVELLQLQTTTTCRLIQAMILGLQALIVALASLQTLHKTARQSKYHFNVHSRPVHGVDSLALLKTTMHRPQEASSKTRSRINQKPVNRHGSACGVLAVRLLATVLSPRRGGLTLSAGSRTETPARVIASHLWIRAKIEMGPKRRHSKNLMRACNERGRGRISMRKGDGDVSILKDSLANRQILLAIIFCKI